MKRTYSALAALPLIFALNGCAADNFLAVSSAPAPDGGIYAVAGNEPNHILSLGAANFITAAADKRNFYASISRLPGKKNVGGVAHLQLDTDKKMTVCKVLPTPGNTPCHLTISPDGKYLYCANYGGGSITEIKLQDNHLYGEPRIIKHSGKSVHKRQKSPHPHFAAFDKLKNQLYICDLGTDEILIYNYDPRRGIELPCAARLTLPPGSGPRHMVFSPTALELYCANELNSTATSFIRQNADSPWKLTENHSTLPDNIPAAKNYPGAIKMSSDGRFFFVTNRGNDSIAVFAIQGSGKFKLQQTVPANGSYPSDILLQNNDRKMRVVNLKSSHISSFIFDHTNGTLTAEKNAIPLQKGIALSGY